METLTEEEYKKRYGEVGLDTLNKTFKKEPSLGQNAKDFGIGFAKGIGGTVKFAADVGRTVTDPLLGALDPNKSIAEYKAGKSPLTDEMLKSKNAAQTAGKVTESIAEWLIPFGGPAKSVAKKTVTGAAQTVSNVKTLADGVKSGAPQKIAKAILGESDTALIKAGQNKGVKAYKTGEKKVSDVVNLFEKGIKQFETNSKKELQAVKNSLPDVNLGGQRIGEVVNDGIMRSVQSSADYRGVRSGFETVDDIIQSGIYKPEETERLKKVVEFIGKWKDTSARGTLNLKESLSNFYATGENYTGSNAVIRSIQRNLVDLVSEVDPAIKPALKKASQNIEKTDDFLLHLFGRDSVSGESKLLTLARSMRDPARSGTKLNLVKELEKATGMKMTDELKTILDYLESSKLTPPGLQAPMESAKYLLKKGVERYIPLE